MSLNYNLSRTEWAKQDETAREQEWPVVNAIILSTMVLGVDGISEKNVEEVVTRIRFFEALEGGFLTQRGKSIPIPEPIIRSLIGLTVNVSPVSWKAFSRRIADNWYKGR